MSVQLGDEVPDFSAESTQGTINFHDWIGDGWAVLFSHPKDFTPVCTTELGSVASLEPEFAKRGCKIIGLSVDSVSDHTEWSKDIEDATGHAVAYHSSETPILRSPSSLVCYSPTRPEAPATGRRATTRRCANCS